MLHFKKLEEIYTLIREKKTEEAIAKISNLEKADIEFKGLGASKRWSIFDYAMEEQDLEVANEIITRYAEVYEAENKKQQNYQPLGLKPLAIDFDPDTDAYPLLVVGGNFMNSYSFKLYKGLVEGQKSLYTSQIFLSIKELKVAGVNMLLEVIEDSKIKEDLSTELKKFKQDNSADSKILDFHANKAKQSIPYELQQKLPVQQANATLEIANKLHERTSTFEMDNLHTYKLDTFKKDTHFILNSHKEILQTSHGIGKIIADLGNLITRYTGVGLIVSFFKGKTKDFFKGTWDVFEPKAKTAKQQEEIQSNIDSLPSTPRRK